MITPPFKIENFEFMIKFEFFFNWNIPESKLLDKIASFKFMIKFSIFSLIIINELNLEFK